MSFEELTEDEDSNNANGFHMFSYVFLENPIYDINDIYEWMTGGTPMTQETTISQEISRYAEDKLKSF